MTTPAKHLSVRLIQNQAISYSGHEDLISTVLPYATIRRFKKGDQIVETSSRDHSLYFVHTGGVEVCYTKDKKKIVAALITPGQFLGEVGFFDHGLRSRDIYALDKTELYIFPEKALRTLQADNPGIYVRFLTFIAKSICNKFRRILDERQVSPTYTASLSHNKKSYDSCSLPITDEYLWSSQWKAIHTLVEDFKADLFDVSHALQDNQKNEISAKLQQEFTIAIDKFAYSLLQLEETIKNSENEDVVRGYIFKETFPYVMRSRFGDRAYFKPKGYAGDFKMIEHLYANKPAGDGGLGILVDRWLLNTPAALAIRGRRDLLTEQLKKQTRDLATTQSIHIMNLACGSNRELFDFIKECPYADKINATCIDMDIEALEFTNKHVNNFSHSATIRLLNDNLIKWALGRNRYDYLPQDIIYSSGLMDYIERKLFIRLVDRCYENLKPDGILMLGNFSPANPNKPLMDHILSWKLIHRDQAELCDIFSHTQFKSNITIISEKQGINLFAVAKKI